MKRSDATNFWICNGCGTIPIYNEKEKLFVCSMCDGPVEFSGTTAETLALIQPLKRSRVTFSKVEMPYALKLLEQEVTTYTGSGLRFITEKSVGRLRDSVLNWGSLEQEQEQTQEDQEQTQGQKGGGTPEPPQGYINQFETDTSVIETLFPTTQEAPEGAPNNEVYAAFGGAANYKNTSPNAKPLTGVAYINQYTIGESGIPQEGGVAPVSYVDSAPALGVTYGDGVSTDGQAAPAFFDSQVAPVSDSPDAPISIHMDLPDFKERADTICIQNGGNAPVNHIDEMPRTHNDGYTHKGADPTINFIDTHKQSGGEAPVDYVDPVPVKRNIEEVWTAPEPKAQTGGTAPVEMIGTDINQATFSVPSLDKEPYVVANPYVAPAMYPREIEQVGSNPAFTPQTPALELQPVSNTVVGEVLNTVQNGGDKTVVFENSEIRVVKLQ